MFWDMHNTEFCSDQVTVSLEFLPFPRMHIWGLCLGVKKNGISQTPLKSLKQWGGSSRMGYHASKTSLAVTWLLSHQCHWVCSPDVPFVASGRTKARCTLAVHLSVVLVTVDHPSLPKLHPRTISGLFYFPLPWCSFHAHFHPHWAPSWAFRLSDLHVLGSLPRAATFSHMKMTSNRHQFQFLLQTLTGISNSLLNTNALGSSHFIHYGPFPKFIALGMATLSPATQMRQQDLSGALSLLFPPISTKSIIWSLFSIPSALFLTYLFFGLLQMTLYQTSYL